MSVLNIWIGVLWDNYYHRKIREGLLGSAGVVSFTGLSNWCKFELANQQAGISASATELELIRFWPFPFLEIVWQPSTQVNNDNIPAYINVFGPRRGKRRRFIKFMVYDMIYTSIDINLMNLATLNPLSDSVRTHTCYPFSLNPS